MQFVLVQKILLLDCSFHQDGSSRLPEVSHEEREKGKVLLQPLHKSAGHPSNQSLARLIRDRKLLDG